MIKKNLLKFRVKIIYSVTIGISLFLYYYYEKLIITIVWPNVVQKHICYWMIHNDSLIKLTILI